MMLIEVRSSSTHTKDFKYMLHTSVMIEKTYRFGFLRKTTNDKC